MDRYESEVDALLEQAGLGEGNGGVDAERQATYQAAENCSERLTEMNQSLTAMIEGINEASTKLSTSSKKSGTDGGEDPLSQIVRVLNSHLAQLQVIDSGAADLGKRVERAKVEAGVAGSRLGGGGVRGGEGLVEGFGQSYLGRREGY